jgi:CheY-like chemotaxis protein
MMGGDITVTSELGKGSTFTAKVLAKVPDTAEPAPDFMASADSGAGGLVLVIDDDPASRELVQRHLVRAGYRTQGASGGTTGLELARQLKPAAITLDVLMPDMDGWSVLAALKADPELSAIPVIMATILDEKPLSLALGASDYITKPVDRERLTALMRKYATSSDSRILIVEDDKSTRDMMKRMLKKEGWTPVEASNGRVALERVAQKMPAVILLDLMMPEMDGFAFLSALREREDGKNVPVIVVSALELSNEDRRRLNGGVQQILQKGSYSHEVLLEELRGALGAASPKPTEVYS